MAKVFHLSEWPARRCSGPCNQGRGPGRPGSDDPCPCPEACEVAEPGRTPITPSDGRIALALLLAPWLLALGVGLLMWWQA